MSSSDHEPMPFALFNIYLLLIHGVFPELAKVWNLPYLLDRFGIIPDNKYPVWTIFSSLQHVAVTGRL